MSNQCMLTTTDNPFDPFEEFTSWFLFDVGKGYNTCSYLGRLVRFFPGMTQKEEDEEVERVIDEILTLNPVDFYRKVWRKNKNK